LPRVPALYNLIYYYEDYLIQDITVIANSFIIFGTLFKEHRIDKDASDVDKELAKLRRNLDVLNEVERTEYFLQTNKLFDDEPETQISQ
jgi:hypothetical protein